MKTIIIAVLTILISSISHASDVVWLAPNSKVVYLIHYEGYYWSPCSGNTCYTINCGSDGCWTDEDKTMCPDKQCIKDKLKQRGEQHLKGVWEIDLDYQNPARKMKVIPSYEVE